MGIYVKQSDIREKVEEIKKLSLDLDQYSEDFIRHIDEIQDLLVGLKVCLNTTGGVRKIKELADIEFDTVSFNNIIRKICEININYRTKRENSNKIIPDFFS